MIIIKKEEIYTWLVSIKDYSYLLHLRMLKVFGSSYELYECSKNKEKFKKILKENNIYLSNSLLNDLTSDSIKKFSQNVYSYMSLKNINIVSIYSKKYPKKILENTYNPPLCLFIKGDICLNNDNYVYLHYDNKFSMYGKNIYVDLSMYLKKKKVYRLGIEIKNSDIIVKSITQENIFDNIDKILKLEKNCIFVINDTSNKYVDLEVMSLFIDFCIIPELWYEKNSYTRFLIDILIENSKDILVVPGSIYSKNSYFSNHLIKEGAEMLLNKKNIDKYIKK